MIGICEKTNKQTNKQPKQQTNKQAISSINVERRIKSEEGAAKPTKMFLPPFSVSILYLLFFANKGGGAGMTLISIQIFRVGLEII